jgi:hypothetical protein
MARHATSLHLAAFATLTAGASLAGPSFIFEKIVDTETTVPGGSERFLGFGAPSLDDGGHLVFCALAASGGSGLYTNVGGKLQVVADASVPIPGQETTFAHGFRSYGASIDDGNIAFYAFTQSTELGGGVYRWEGGVVSLVADGNTPIPGGTGTFNAIEDPFGFGPFSHPPADGANIAFRAAADSPRQRGIYTFIDGSLDVVADLTTPVPSGTGPFTFLSAEITMQDGAVAFRGEGENRRRGIYTNRRGELVKVVDTTDPIPGGTGVFTSVTYPWFDGGTILFAGDGSDGQQGIYRWEGGAVSAFVDRTTPIPEGEGTFTDFLFNWSPPAASHGRVVFWARGAGGQEGIYFADAHSLAKVIDTTDTLDGKTIVSLTMGQESLAGSTLAFLVRFGDDSSALYLARPTFRRGDSNGDGACDLGDAVQVLGHLFAGERRPDCSDAAGCHHRPRAPLRRPRTTFRSVLPVRRRSHAGHVGVRGLSLVPDPEDVIALRGPLDAPTPDRASSVRTRRGAGHRR